MIKFYKKESNNLWYLGNKIIPSATSNITIKVIASLNSFQINNIYELENTLLIKLQSILLKWNNNYVTQ